MRNLKARSVMVKPVVSARVSTAARDVATQLLSGLYSGMPVTDEAGKVVGVVSELDLLGAALDGKDLSQTTVGQIMSRAVVTADVDATVDDMIKKMEEHHIIRLPITDQGKLVGVVARCDILRTVIEPMILVL